MAEHRFRDVSFELVEAIVHRRELIRLLVDWMGGTIFHPPMMFVVMLWEEGTIHWQHAAAVPEIRWIPYLTRSTTSVLLAVIDGDEGAHFFRLVSGRIDVLLRGEWSPNRMREGKLIREVVIGGPICI